MLRCATSHHEYNCLVLVLCFSFIIVINLVLTFGFIIVHAIERG
jgi:hypothetical protein